MRSMAVRCLFALLVFSVAAGPVLAAGEAATPSENVAKVNDATITRAEFDRELQFLLQQYMVRGMSVEGDQLDKIRKSLLDTLVGKELLLQKTREAGVKVDPAQVKERMAMMKDRFGGEERYRQGLESMNLTEEGLAEKLEQSLAVEKFVDDNIAGKVSVSEDEMKEFYDSHLDAFKVEEQVHARHILVKVDDGADEATKKAAREKIDGINKELHEGKDFAELAKENSDCPSSQKGGDLGFFGRNQMVKPFEDAAFATEPGQMSDVVETPFGYHIIKVEEKKPAHTISFNEVRPRLQKYLRAEKVKSEIDSYVQGLKTGARIETYL